MLGFLQRYRFFLSKFVMANGKFLFSLVFMFIFAERKNYGYERVYEQIGMDGFGFGHSSRIRGG